MLMTNWHFPPLFVFYYLLSQIPLVLLPPRPPAMVQRGTVCKRLSSLPGASGQLGCSMLASTTSEPAVQQCLAPQGGVPQPALTSTHLPVCITGITATLNGVGQVCRKTLNCKGQIKIITDICNFHQVRLLAPSPRCHVEDDPYFKSNTKHRQRPGIAQEITATFPEVF